MKPTKELGKFLRTLDSAQIVTVNGYDYLVVGHVGDICTYVISHECNKRDIKATKVYIIDHTGYAFTADTIHCATKTFYFGMIEWYGAEEQHFELKVPDGIEMNYDMVAIQIICNFLREPEDRVYNARVLK